MLVFVLGALGLACSRCPFVVIDRLTSWEAASATETLQVIAIGCVPTVPVIAGDTVFSYRVFRGEASPLDYA